MEMSTAYPCISNIKKKTVLSAEMNPFMTKFIIFRKIKKKLIFPPFLALELQL